MTEIPIIIVNRTFTCKIKGNNRTAEKSRGERLNGIQGQLMSENQKQTNKQLN